MFLSRSKYLLINICLNILDYIKVSCALFNMIVFSYILCFVNKLNSLVDKYYKRQTQTYQFFLVASLSTESFISGAFHIPLINSFYLVFVRLKCTI